ncbi:hypothetical protein [Novosphingobium sp. Fuku2-ISO-50]|uniref:hypothetical protein n=1 Tax=Novosphingobium sp. Fuku2-ISO-50 TaxID=1739114 RepID=UPI00076D08CC|nr:hypothetical protein [Novosphingobium sp. Fuku2-ISO-50]KUR74207.1 hypothetical protein AQZ50_18040 [Novosphingobium sp. Fuku2-ISO-50]
MNNITRLPANVLNQIDREQIYEEFRERLSRLGDLRRARDEHEQRNWLGRWWYKGEMDEAQLDAQLLQAEFAESLAKLMAINLVQSQQLEQQQHVIGLQQERLAEQNAKLQQQTEMLNSQQVDLKKQGDDLEKLVREFFELKGLTEGEARKLIAIANEVKATKSDMYEHFEACVQELRQEDIALKLSVGDTVSAALIEQQVALNAAETNFNRRYDGHELRFSKHIEATEAQNHAVETRLNEQGSAITALDDQLIRVNHEQVKLQEKVDENRALELAAEQKTDARFRLTMQRVWWSVGIGASGLIVALGTLIATHRLFG